MVSCQALFIQLTLRHTIFRRLGYVKPEDVPNILDNILDRHTLDWDPFTSQPLLPNHWRGRMGLGKEQQLSLAVAHAS